VSAVTDSAGDAGETRARAAWPALEWTMFALALLMVPLVVAQESASDPELLLWIERASALIWVAFVGEYIYLFALADNKRRFVRAHWFDLLIIALTPPIALLPNELDTLRALRALRVVRAIAVIGRANHTLRRFLRRDSLPYIVALSLFVVVIGGLAIHGLEPETAESVGDGLWWAAATLSTVGYGDIAPKTLLGRILAVGIMVIGVSTFAVLTAGIASLFVRTDDRDSEDGLAEVRSELRRITSELQQLRASQRGDEPPKADASVDATMRPVVE
jgi:voltage-gated potassium channel